MHLLDATTSRSAPLAQQPPPLAHTPKIHSTRITIISLETAYLSLHHFIFMAGLECLGARWRPKNTFYFDSLKQQHTFDSLHLGKVAFLSWAALRDMCLLHWWYAAITCRFGATFTTSHCATSRREAVKMALLIATAIPRFILIQTFLAILAATNTLAVRNCDLTKPLPPRRRRIVEFFSSLIFGIILRLMGFRLYVKGQENIRKAKEQGPVVSGCLPNCISTAWYHFGGVPVFHILNNLHVHLARRSQSSTTYPTPMRLPSSG